MACSINFSLKSSCMSVSSQRRLKSLAFSFFRTDSVIWGFLAFWFQTFYFFQILKSFLRNLFFNLEFLKNFIVTFIEVLGFINIISYFHCIRLHALYSHLKIFIFSLWKGAWWERRRVKKIFKRLLLTKIKVNQIKSNQIKVQVNIFFLKIAFNGIERSNYG